MNTPTHLIISATLLSERHAARFNGAVLFGALVPDISLYVLFFWARFIAGIPERTLWGQVYWQEPWQTISAVSNSLPLYASVAVVAYFLGARLLAIGAISSIVHLCFDFPFHNTDAHVHFWPFSDWRFHSPISYWDPRHFGDIVAVVEIVLAVSCMALLWRRFEGRGVRAVLFLSMASYVAVPVYFSYMLH